MENFLKLSKDIDPKPFLTEIDNVPSAWEQLTGRQDKIKVQREALAIPLRGIRKSKVQDRRRSDVHESRNTTMSRNFPLIMQFIKDFAEVQNALPGRAKIANLPPAGKVFPHIDRGEYYLPRDRFHLVLQSSPGNFLAAGTEKVHLQVGELWWFDNKLPHEAQNNSKQSRIHIIFDLEPKSPEGFIRARFKNQLVSEQAPDAEPQTTEGELPHLAALSPDLLEIQLESE
jgi:aspartyl/asparaginyl beta-hydroxylase (cupin superfamily)